MSVETVKQRLPMHKALQEAPPPAGPEADDTALARPNTRIYVLSWGTRVDTSVPSKPQNMASLSPLV